MKFIVIAVVLLTIFELSLAEDDGQYRPEKYGDDGKYHPAQDGQYYDRYRNLYGTENLFYPYNPYYTQRHYKNLSPYQQLLTPYTDYRNRLAQEASSLVSVTSRPPTIYSTARPITYASPTNVVPIYKHQYNDGYARIVNQDSDADENSYHYKYLTENGINAEESGVVDSVKGGTRTSGFFEYIGDDGVKYRVDYTADENGFRPTGAHLP